LHFDGISSYHKITRRNDQQAAGRSCRPTSLLYFCLSETTHLWLWQQQKLKQFSMQQQQFSMDAFNTSFVAVDCVTMLPSELQNENKSGSNIILVHLDTG
jgi:hypothetical protein